MIKKLRRNFRPILQFYLNRMPLARSDFQTILAKGKSLFIIRCHDLLQFFN